MTQTMSVAKTLRRGLACLVLAGALAAAGSGAAFAGGCPADKVVADGAGQPKSDAKAAGVTDTVIASTDLANEPIGIKDRAFRLRKLVVQPGGVVPWHSHGNRPAIIYIITGEIVEYPSSCSVPIVHKAGDSTTETHTTSHWWKNLGKTTVVLLSADLFPSAGEHEHMM